MLLLVQQRDQFFLHAYVAFDPPVGVIEEANDGVLFGEGWKRHRNGAQSTCRDFCKGSSCCETLQNIFERLEDVKTEKMIQNFVSSNERFATLIRAKISLC